MSDIPEHRRAIAPRSGDDHVIGEHGELRNLDQESRDRAAAEAAAAEAATQRKGRKADPDSSGEPA